jgi:hypothetical protein
MSEANDLLRRLVREGDVAAVERLLAERPAGLDIHRRDDGGATVLHLAAGHGPAAMVALLLDAGARPWIEDDAGRSAARVAAVAPADPDRRLRLALLTEVRFGEDGLHDAVAALDAGDVEGLRAILDDDPGLVHRRAAGGDAITRGYFTRPALLHFVAANPSRPTSPGGAAKPDGGERLPPRVLESTAAILDAGAEVDAVTLGEAPHTTLALVASSGPAHDDGLVAPLLDLLVERGADPARGLEAAVVHRRTETVRTLLRLGAEPSLPSAAGLGDVGALRRLLAGHTSETERKRAAWAAVRNGEVATLEALLDAGVEVGATLPRPFDPQFLHEAAWCGHREVVERLLARGADPTCRDTQYDGTPAGWARHAGHHELAARLAEAEAAWRSGGRVARPSGG